METHGNPIEKLLAFLLAVLGTFSKKELQAIVELGRNPRIALFDSLRGDTRRQGGTSLAALTGLLAALPASMDTESFDKEIRPDSTFWLNMYARKIRAICFGEWLKKRIFQSSPRQFDVEKSPAMLHLVDLRAVAANTGGEQLEKITAASKPLSLEDVFGVIADGIWPFDSRRRGAR